VSDVSTSAHTEIAVRSHPRSVSLIRRGKGVGGLGGFALAASASALHGAVLFDLVLRGLAAGAIGYLLGWAAAVYTARHLLKAEVQAAAERALERHRRWQAGAADR